MGKENVGFDCRLPKTFSSSSFYSSHMISMVSTSVQPFVSGSLHSSDLTNLHRTREILQPLPEFISLDNTSNLLPPASLLRYRRQKLPLPPKSTFISLPQHLPCVPSPPSEGSYHNTLRLRTPPHSPAPLGFHSQSCTSSAKSMNTSFGPVFPPLASQATPCGKELPYQPTQKDFPRMRLNPLGDGKVMPSTSISMTPPKLPLLPISLL